MSTNRRDHQTVGDNLLRLCVSRALAFWLDWIVVSFVGLPLVVASSAPLRPYGVIILWLVYRTLGQASRFQTLGRRATRTKLRLRSGVQRPALTQVLFRELPCTLAVAPILWSAVDGPQSLFLLAGALWLGSDGLAVIISGGTRSLHDWVGRTEVVLVPSAGARSSGIAREPSSNGAN